MSDTTLTEEQFQALKCAIADLQGAIQRIGDDSFLPGDKHDACACQQSIDELLAAFPSKRLADWYEPLGYPPQTLSSNS